MIKKLLTKKSYLALLGMLVLGCIMPSLAFAAPLDFDQVTGGIGVDPVDVVQTGFSFMGMFDQWTMLVLGIIFAPVAIGFLVWLFRKLPRFGGRKS